MSQAGTHASVFVPFGLNRAEAAHYVGVSPNTFDRMVTDGLMPRPRQVYSRKIWDRRAIELAFAQLPGDDEADAPNPFDGD